MGAVLLAQMGLPWASMPVNIRLPPQRVGLRYPPDAVPPRRSVFGAVPPERMSATVWYGHARPAPVSPAGTLCGKKTGALARAPRA